MSSDWHWKTKDVKPWCEKELTAKLVGLEKDGVSISKLADLEGDAEVGMRKGKVITVYDLKVNCKWEGPEDSTGTLTAIEVSHDMEASEYQFEATTDQATSAADKAKQIARTRLADLMRPIFQQLPKDMVSIHGKGLLAQTSADSPTTSGASTPLAASASTKTKTATSSSSVNNTTSVKVESAFQISAADLFELLTDPSKVPMWTRNPAKISLEQGADVALFGGNIVGKMQRVDKPKEFVMTWRAPTWPDNHFGLLTATLLQGSADTTLALKLSGVPTGKEEETEKNLELYYIRSLKQIGYDIYPKLAPVSVKSAPTQTQKVGLTLATLLAPVLSLGVMLAVLAAIYYGPTFQQS